MQRGATAGMGLRESRGVRGALGRAYEGIAWERI